jgi:succinate dehydrogenase/fumarate reductase-like Fe-S protein
MKFITIASALLAAYPAFGSPLQQEKRDLADEILQALEKAATCVACEVSIIHDTDFWQTESWIAMMAVAYAHLCNIMLTGSNRAY